MGRGRRRLDGEERSDATSPSSARCSERTSTRSPAGGDDGVTTRDILRAGGLSSRDRPDLLVGGPPCVAFSKSGFWLDWKRDGVDPAASLLQAYTRVLAEAKPRFFILENVYALTFNNKASRPAFERLLREIDAAGYQFQWRVLNAADYGVPQARPRLFIVGCRKRDRAARAARADAPRAVGAPRDRGRAAPPRHHRRGARRARHRARAGRGRARAAGATCCPRSRPARTTCTTPPSAATPTRSSSGGRGTGRSCSSSIPTEPSPTIQAQPGPNVGPFHWENRRLRVPELRRLFTFPDDYAFVGRRASVQAQIGNCVPPLLAEQVAEQRRRSCADSACAASIGR